MLAFDAQQHLVSLLKLGTSLDQVYTQTKQFIAERNPGLAERAHTNFGFGIGCSHKEELLSINSNNNKTKVQGGMVFHVRITFKDVEKDKRKGAIAIGDTVVVNGDGSTQFLTASVARKYQQISYKLEDEDEEQDDESAGESEGAADRKTKAGSSVVNGNAILSTRTRGAAAKPSASKAAGEESLKKGQDALLDEKLEELKGRYERDEIQVNSKKQKLKNMGLIQSYSSVKRLPSDLKKGHLYVDE